MAEQKQKRGLEIPKELLDEFPDIKLWPRHEQLHLELAFAIGIIKGATDIKQIITDIFAATNTPAGVGTANGSDTDTTTPLPESEQDEHPTACNDKCGDKADSRDFYLRGQQGD